MDNFLPAGANEMYDGSVRWVPMSHIKTHVYQVDIFFSWQLRICDENNNFRQQ